MRFNIARTKKGLPALWESGGGMSNTGYSRIIADCNSNPKKAIYIRNRGELSCGEHALIPVTENDYIIESNHHRGDFNIKIYKIISIYDDYLEADVVNTFSEGEWYKDLENKFENAIDSAKRKALHYHCRIPYYIREQI